MNAPRKASIAPLPRRKAVLMGLAFVAVGLYPLAIGVGLATARPGSVHAPLWVVALAGTCFVLVGTVLAVPQGDVRLRGPLVGLVVTALAAIFDWVAFGPGERHFGGAMSFAGASIATGTSEASGRIAFGIAAAMLDAFALWGWYRWLRGPAPRAGGEPQSGIE